VNTDTKQIIDKHFTDNRAYYSTICKERFKERYLWEDLLHETYLGFLKVKPNVILACQDTAYLKHIGKKVLFSILQKKGFCKKNSNGKDSPLFELANDIDFNFDIFENQQVEQLEDREMLIDKINGIVYEGLANNDFDTEVFVMSQIESVSSISKRIGVNYYSVSKAQKKAIESIKKQLA